MLASFDALVQAHEQEQHKTNTSSVTQIPKQLKTINTQEEFDYYILVSSLKPLGFLQYVKYSFLS